MTKTFPHTPFGVRSCVHLYKLKTCLCRCFDVSVLVYACVMVGTFGKMQGCTVMMICIMDCRKFYQPVEKLITLFHRFEIKLKYWKVHWPIKFDLNWSNWPIFSINQHLIRRHSLNSFYR